jgi:uncharacterized protein (TIGR02246 family)
MRTVTTLAVLALATVVSACAAPTAQEFTRTDADAIRKTSDDLSAAFNAKDIEKVMSLYAENSAFMPPNAPMLRGKDALKTYFDSLLAKGATELTLTPVDVAGAGPLAYESGTYSISYGNNGKTVRDRGKYLRVLRNMNGTWRSEYTIWSSDLPPQAPPTTD